MLEKFADIIQVKMDVFANFYSCNPGVFSLEGWTCQECYNDTTFYFDPGSLFVPQIVAAMAIRTITVTNSMTEVLYTASTTTSSSSIFPNVSSCPTKTKTITVISSRSEMPTTTGTGAGSLSTSSLRLCSTQSRVVVGVSVGLGIALAFFSSASFFFFSIERKQRKAAEKVVAQARTNGSDQIDWLDYFAGEMAQAADSQSRHEVHNNELIREAGSNAIYEVGI